MLSKTRIELEWRNVGENIDVTHFSSAVSGQQIYVKKIQSAAPGPITLFLLHDLCSYHGRFKKFYQWFQHKHPDITIVMMDFGGHGLSTGTRGHLNQFSDVVTDAQQFFELFSPMKHEQDKWFALGNGLGGLVLLDLLNQADGAVKRKIDGIILSNFMLNFDSPSLRLQNQLLDRLTGAASKSLDHLRLQSIFMPESMLTHSKDRTELMEDPLVLHRPTIASLRNISEKVRSIYQNAYFLDKPTLVLQSTSPYLHHNGIDSFCKGIKKDLLKEKKYLNLRHDLYNESEKQSVFKDIAEWVRT